MKYSDDKKLFERKLMENISPYESDYAFFVADILDSLKGSAKVNILPYSPYGNGFTDSVIDLVLEGNTLEFYFKGHEKYKVILSRREIKQVAPAKYYVNCEREGQSINVRFIR